MVSLRGLDAIKALPSRRILLLVVAVLLFISPALAKKPIGPGFPATDPGVRLDKAGAGDPISGLSANQTNFFYAGSAAFQEVEGVGNGLGPRFNLDSCKGCHAYPAVGGTSPATNPEYALAQTLFPNNTVPSFITPNGPIREARFIQNRDGTPDGGVHDLFVINNTAMPSDTGMPGCVLAQPDFATQLAQNNVIFRIPTPVFGAGLMEAIPDSTIRANQQANAAAAAAMGISGKANHQNIAGEANANGNDGTISRFGWKAQNKSLLLFSGEAYNVEMGITNELFQTEREENPFCQGTTVPNSVLNTETSDFITGLSDIEKFAFFMRVLAPLVPSTTMPGGADSITRGRTLFGQVGCALCHTPTLNTGNSPTIAALANQDVNLFSDLLVHHMGKGLADGVTQGAAGPDEFRSAPLWGLGERIFFLHDGRTTDLLLAIGQHASPQSEANNVIKNFNRLTEMQKQDILNFLRSL